MSTQHLHFKKRWRSTGGVYCFYIAVFALLTLLRPLPAKAQNPSANLDQGSNGKATSPTDPVDWVNGNLNENTAHFREGYSVPYRAILTGLTVNQTYTLVIGWDVKHGGKQALDYITHYQRLEPHAPFGHPAETVNPLLGITGFPPAYFTSTDTYPIPAPSSAGSPVAGMPTASFNALPAGERVMTGFNADLLSMAYTSQGDLNADQSETVINITFKALKETVVLSWGGHIASLDDWGIDPATGEPRSATGISGSPYHMRLKEWIINGQEVSIGNQDRSLKTAAVFAPPQASVTGPTSACAETSSLNYTATISGDTTGITYAWTLLNNTTNAVIADPTLKTITVQPSSGTFTAGSFNLRLIVTNSHGLKDTAYINSSVSPGDLVTIKKVLVDATATPSTLDLAISNHSQLNAVPSGGTPSYNYVWAPATGLSSTTIANPVFTAPGPGSFQFIVTVTDSKGCVGKDTVVVTVTASKMPCGITGPTPVCPSSTNSYDGPPDPNGLIGSYQWFIKTSVGSALQGATNTASVSVKSGPHCGTDTLYLALTSPSGLLHDTCSTIIMIQDGTPPTISGVPSNITVACASDVPAVATNVTASDNCGLVRLGFSQATHDSTCVNHFTIVRTWMATDSCGNTASASQTIIVKDSIAPAITADFDKSVSVQCVSNIPGVPTPTATDNCGGSVTMAFNATGSGKACDSTITRKWIFTDACGNKDSVMQAVHVKDTIPPTLSGSAPNSTVTCAKDVPGVPTITATDNCDATPVITYNQVTSDSTCINHFTLTRTWFATDNCGNMSTTLTQVITVNDNVKPVITANFVKDTSVQCMGQIPAAPSPTASDNCSGDISPMFSVTGSGQACDSAITRKWLFVDACGNKDSVSQVIHVKDTTRPVISGNTPNASATCAKDVPAPPTVTATDNCDASPAIIYNQVTSDSTCANHFTVTRTWYAMDKCGNVSSTLTQVITVNDNVKPSVVFTPGDVTIGCNASVVFGTPSFSDNCGGAVKIDSMTWVEGTSCPFKHIRRWIATDACGNKDSTQQTVTVSCCLVTCTYTQGFYGNQGGTGCAPDKTTFMAQGKMASIVDAQPGDSVLFGLKSTSKYFTLFLSDITSGNIFNMLPGGGTPVALKGYATYSKISTWPNVPLVTSGSQAGKIKNTLLAQTMALFFNMNLSSDLPGLTIVSDSLFTAKQTTCGSGVPVAQTDTTILPANVVKYLQTSGPATVKDLYALANMYLGGQAVSGITASDVNNAITDINQAFDQCALLVGWGESSFSTIAARLIASNPTAGSADNNTPTADMQLSVFPNPYGSVINFRFRTPISGRVELVIYNIVGQKLATIDRGYIQAQTWQTIQYHVPPGTRPVLVYRLLTGMRTVSGKILPHRGE